MPGAMLSSGRTVARSSLRVRKPFPEEGLARLGLEG